MDWRQTYFVKYLKYTMMCFSVVPFCFISYVFSMEENKSINIRADPLAQPRGPPGVRGPPFEKHWSA
jgi:hypothetical protein